ncbi:type IV toxin-antitoxin system AbiEi family antitoxin domain-containing protein [Phycicoccus sp. BSK3Z-2]|uniref:Type IV toxin-antitoxin system AbiEi family antitoxin domain-containing protein n=1 Tax=Phycicoccus avicenniae TaxID=2828860 RepID=A0A941DAF9_9MICO|nr:type IV toxin-antitoxin system AbiEi family antitoxin domain-containing protein [Phycicoccus avicenniae]MBR7744093.1 type IV toxin-antitoxin system AbiEi family antitoxin domain-containing protein [Phycicoccus avicenniae]
MDLDRLVAAQHGVVTTRQALDAGLSEDALRWRVESGRWSRLGRGVYLTRSGPQDWFSRAHAVVLRAGPGAALALGAAEYLHGVSARPPAVITLWVPRDRRMTRLPGTRVARRRVLHTEQRRGLPVTSAVGTVLDLADAPGVGAREAVAIAARWAQCRRVTADEVATALHTRPRHRHRGALMLALGVVAEGAESVLEVGFVRGVERRHGLPTARLQVPAGSDGHRLRRDAEYVGYGVVVELDGRLGHEGEFVAVDRRRDRSTARSGRITLRAGWVDVDQEPCELAVDIHETLRSRGWSGRGRRCGPRCPMRHVLGSAA